jgi:lipopolysaccharide biosynthesis regulator YciM
MRLSLLSFTAGCLVLAGSAMAQERLQSARNALAEALPDVAALRIERYLESQSDLSDDEKAPALLLLGECQLRAGRISAALATLADVPDQLASERNYWQGIALAKEQKRSDALEKLAQVAVESDLYEQALLNKSELQARQGQLAEALTTLSSIREHNPDFLASEIALLEARLLLEADEPEKALSAWKTLSGDDQKKPTARLLAGRIALAQQDYEKALTSFQTVLAGESAQPAQPLALLGKSDALLASGSPDEAKQPLLDLLKQENDSSLLSFLHSRFEKLLTLASETSELTAALSAFVDASTLGEDSNYATPPKLFACYYLARISEPQAAKDYLSQIISLSPEGDLAARAHLLQARLELADNNTKAAKKSLASVDAAAPDSSLAFRAADILARLEVTNGNLAEARSLFAEAAQHPEAHFAEQALLNQAILQWSKNAQAPLSALTAKLDSSEAKVSLELEKALALARTGEPSATDALKQFVLRYPKHPRRALAQLTLANLLLSEPQPDFELVEGQLSSLPDNLTRPLSRESFRVSHRLAAITNDWTNAVSWGERHLKAFPEAQDDPYFLLPLAESSFQNGDYNRSRYLFSRIAELPEAGELAELASLYAAHSNLLIPTSEATGEALDILDKIVKEAGPLASRARLIKARTLLKNLGQAEESLQILQAIPGEPGDQPEAALLKAEAHRELAYDDPKHAERAVTIYKSLLADPRTSYQLSNQIHYQLALTHRENDQLNLAIEPCLRVVDLENKPEDEKEVEWDYYYRCGFEAIDILLEADRARAALILARKLAKTGGPGAAQAEERAQQIQLDHLLWTD